MDTPAESPNEEAAVDEVVEATNPPPVDKETGVAIGAAELPVNHRLRAEALAKAGKDKDPAGEISDELIAETAERLEREEEAEEEREAAELAAHPPVHENMRVSDIEKIAKRENVDLSAAANNADRVRLIEEARAATSSETSTETEES